MTPEWSLHQNKEVNDSFRFSGFTDEAAASAADQVAIAVECRLAGIDVRSSGSLNVTEMPSEVLREFVDRASDAGIGIQSVGSPVNKVPLAAENRQGEIEKLKRSIAAAHSLGTKRVRIFSPEVPAESLTDAWPEVRDWMSEMISLAAAENMILLHENDARFYGAYPEGAKRIFGELSGPSLRAAFDFSNTVILGFDPCRDWLDWILPDLDSLHIKDYSLAQNKVVAAGEGDSGMETFMARALASGWRGTFSLEPHLETAGPFGGTSGPEKFAYAAKKMKEVVTKAAALARSQVDAVGG